MNEINTLAQITAIALATTTLIEQPTYQQTIKALRLPSKPFDCATCLPLWITLAYQIPNLSFMTPIWMLAAATLGTLIHRQHNTF